MIGEDGQIVLPASFIEVAERFGLIREIDRWVLRQAIGLLGRQRADGARVRFEVNLSGKSMDDPELHRHGGARATARARAIPATSSSRSPRLRRSPTWNGPGHSPTG